MKVIAVCGSLIFVKEMMEVAEKMELEGIGNSTAAEIEFAKNLGKEIIYYEDIM